MEVMWFKSIDLLGWKNMVKQTASQRKEQAKEFRPPMLDKGARAYETQVKIPNPCTRCGSVMMRKESKHGILRTCLRCGQKEYRKFTRSEKRKMRAAEEEAEGDE